MKKQFNDNISFELILSKYVKNSYVYRKNKWKKIIYLLVLLYSLICGIYIILEMTNLLVISVILEIIIVIVFSILFIIFSVIQSNIENISKNNLISDYCLNKDNIYIVYQYVLSELNNNDKKSFINRLIELFKNIFIFFIGYSFDNVFDTNVALSINGVIMITLFMFFSLAIVNTLIELVKLFTNNSDYKYYSLAKEIEIYELQRCNNKKNLFKIICDILI